MKDHVNIPKESDIVSDEVELDFSEDDLKEVEISDQTIEAVDKESDQAKKNAKKTAKKLRTPEEKKAFLKKQILIGVGCLIVLIMVLIAAPFTRWPILNAVGFRGTLELTIKDSSNKPIATALVKLDSGTSATTDKFGRAKLYNVSLGKRSVLIQKNGYGDKTITLTSGLGTVKKTEELKIIGIKLDIDIKDWLSNQQIEGATATFGKSTAVSDSTGRASLVIPPTDTKSVEVSVSAPGYITKTLETETSVVSREVALVSAQKDYFVSKRDGKFDIFSSNLDGSDQRKIIDASGKEDESVLQFSIDKNNKQAILVSTREGKVQNGRIIAGIYSIDLEKASLRKIDEGSDIQLFEWSDSTIAYTKSAVDLSYDDPALSRLMSFNSASGKLSQVAQANYFAASTAAINKIFYVPADAYRPIENGVLTSLDLSTGATKRYLQDRPITYIARASYATLEVQDSAGSTFEVQIVNGTAKAIDRRPSTVLQVATSPNSQIATWSDRRDGQGALIVRAKDGTERIAAKLPGLTSPVRFITDSVVVVRVATSQETADYVININSGQFKKVVDVSNVGVSRQYGL